MGAVVSKIVATASIVGAVLAVGALLVQWVGYAAGAARDICSSERWTPWSVQYEGTGTSFVSTGFGLFPLGLSCSSGGNVIYPDEPLASRLVVAALVLGVLAVTLLARPRSSHPQFIAWAVAASAASAAVAVIAGLGTAAGAISFARGGRIDCGVPPVGALGGGALEGVHPLSTVYSVVPTGPVCTYSTPLGEAAVFTGDVPFGSILVIALAVAAAFALLAARSKRRLQAQAMEHAFESGA